MISVQNPSHMTTQQQDLPKDADPERPSTPVTLSGTVSSSSLDEINAALGNTGIATNSSPVGNASGDASASPTADAPSSVCQQRKLSAAIVTAQDASHGNSDIVAGRPTMTVGDLPAKLQFETPPAKLKSSPFSGGFKRGVSTSNPKRTVREDLMGSKHSNGNCSGLNISSLNHKSLTRQMSSPAENEMGKVLVDPPACRVDAWAESPALSFNVRGQTYLKDSRKEPSEEALFTLLTVDIIQTADGKGIMAGICGHPDERIQRALRREKETGIPQLPEFIFCVNLAMPGPPFYHVMIYFGCDDIDVLTNTDTPLGRLAKPFFFGDSDDFRDNTFKLIPRIVDGNFVVKKAVGSKPTILGRKLKQHYIRTPRYLELIVDIQSDAIAKKVVALTVGYAKTLIVDMMFLLEGDSEETLPERILGGVRIKNLDFKKRDGQRKVKNYA